MSPLVDRGHLYVHVGTSGQGALVALDAVTGELKWRWTGDGPACASPIAVDLAGTRQIVTQSQSRIVSVAADSPTWAHPVLVRGGVLVKDASMLTLWGWE